MQISQGHYVQQRGSGRFYFRMVIPPDVRQYFGVREIKRVLPCKSDRTASLLAFRLAARLHEAIDEVRGAMRKKHEKRLYSVTALLTKPDGTTLDLKVERDDADEETQIAAQAARNVRLTEGRRNKRSCGYCYTESRSHRS